MTLAVRIAKALAANERPDGLNLSQSNGDAGGQEVPHFHLHIHPRRTDDGLLRIYGDNLPSSHNRDELDRLAARIASCMQDS